MTDPEQIPHLMKLLDDESLDVRTAVSKELKAFGPNLTNELKRIKVPLNTAQKEYLEEILRGHKRIRLKKNWPKWVNLPVQSKNLTTEYERLEKALTILSEFLKGIDYDFRLKDLLNELMAEYRLKFRDDHPIKLAKFLFKEKGLRGDEKNYYDVQNSNLVHVIKEKRGTPISLAAVYMLVGARLGLKIEGCHFPGHFLARINMSGTNIFVDCFNGGHVITEEDLLSIKEETFKGIEKILQEKTDVQMIVRAFLANLIRSFQIHEDEENSELLIQLFNDMDLCMNSKKMSDLTPEKIINQARPAFNPGQRVSHVRYGYRGIIVDFDSECTATDNWYYGNQTQPSRHQPWYHVLVHGSDQVTYVAENNLTKDSSKKNVTHPLISYFFTKTKEGGYIRNDNIWPETDF